MPGGLGGVPAGIAGVELTEPGAAAEERRRSSALKQDLRCPITLEVMHDPVIAGDGHSYERDAIERWLATHRTSPLTGRIMPSTSLIPNHRLRTLIADIVSGSQTSARSAAAPGQRGHMLDAAAQRSQAVQAAAATGSAEPSVTSSAAAAGSY